MEQSPDVDRPDSDRFDPVVDFRLPRLFGPGEGRVGYQLCEYQGETLAANAER